MQARTAKHILQSKIGICLRVVETAYCDLSNPPRPPQTTAPHLASSIWRCYSCSELWSWARVYCLSLSLRARVRSRGGLPWVLPVLCIEGAVLIAVGYIDRLRAKSGSNNRTKRTDKKDYKMDEEDIKKDSSSWLLMGSFWITLPLRETPPTAKPVRSSRLDANLEIP